MTDTVTTTQGKVQGFVGSNGVFTFLGIPYGADTAGARRFRPPIPAKPWTGVRNTSTYGPTCPQGGSTLARKDLSVHEDCLVLNVWTPGVNDHGKRPVMVWLHGGGFQAGSGSGPLTSGGNLAANGDVVVVSLNHRLNIFGFLYLQEDCGPEFNGSGVAGMLDVVLAMEWIRDNIEAFGGDPANVTIFGESGGGRKVSVLMGMPAARGLFHRGIIESGPHPRGIPAETATRLASRFIEWLGFKTGDGEALQALPTDILFKQFGKFIDQVDDPHLVEGRAGRWLLSPVVDGIYLPADPFSPASPASHDIPLIIGTNKDEAALFLANVPDIDKIDEAQLIKRLEKVLGDRTEAILNIHRKNRPKESRYDLLCAISSEDRRMMSIETAEEKARQSGAPGYLYLAELGGKKYATSGVNGMLDAVLALEWVRDNIAEFGGDQDNVTIFGESGGGLKVGTLMALPRAEGLFHKAVMQSGPGLRGVDPKLATPFAQKVLDHFDIKKEELYKLHDLTSEQLLDAVTKLAGIGPGASGFLAPVVDGKVYPCHAFMPDAAPTAVNIPLIIGTNKDESALFSAADPKRVSFDEEELHRRLDRLLGERKTEILDVYRQNRPRATPWDLYIGTISESMRLWSIQLAEKKAAAGGAPVYMYLFTWESNYMGGIFKSCHAMEIPFVFNNPDIAPFTGKGNARHELAASMSQSWINFARSGDPNVQGLPHWPSYDKENRTTMIFDTPCRVENDPRKEERQVWKGKPLLRT
ncbi:MAG: carboxylesterase family protein [Proteobacteria bacterium]|nr:carboxylesterase family protein [Pseudomonadota bacterium]MBU4470565.1 carboxylesterase family protein [Pseudomonadota bacterium]MCG2751401.1 carboxylesterase family protein [Desulfobacteraceae bacterium]